MSDHEGDAPVAASTAISMSVQGLPSFNPSGEPTALCARWKRWKRAFTLYLTAKNVKDDVQKLALLLHTAGLDFQDLYYTLVPETEVKTYVQSIEVLDGHFVPQCNEPFERHLFRQMKQEEGETIAQYICRLRRKSATCNFHNVDEAIRDQLIDKCKDVNMRRKFLEKTGVVSLDDLQSIARALEAVESQMKSMDSPTQVNAIAKPKSYGKKGGFLKSGPSGRKSDENREQKYQDVNCFRCGGKGHLQRDLSCPARKSLCKKCGLKGHFAAKCRTVKSRYGQEGRQRAFQVEEDDKDDYAFSIETDNFYKNNCVNVIDSKSEMVSVLVGGVKLENMLIDSGASCNLIDKETWEGLKSKGVKCKSSTNSKKLFAYGQKDPIETLGTFQCKVTCDRTKLQSECEFIVVKGPGRPILGKTTAENLNVLRVGPPQQVYTVTTEGTDLDIITRFPELFSGVGKLNNYVHDLHINTDIKPVAQPVRRLPFGLRDKVDKKLDELLEKEVIEKVSGPTQWVSPLVVVPKQGGDIRVCVDMRSANKAILRERHPIPTIEEVLYDMNGATVFSKLDLKWGFHQIELSPKSRPITTFVTHRGLFRYKRLMFGINSAPEQYQKIISDVLQGCRGVTNIADDLIVYGAGVQKHDANLFAVFQKLKQANLTLNRGKCEFRLPKLTFFGQDLGAEGISASEEKIGAVIKARPPENMAEVRSFLGLVQYSAKFLPDLAQVAEPLRRLTRKDVDFVWGTEQGKSFNKLKELMTSAQTLAYFRNECKTRIVADAGPTGIGAVLTQLQGETWRVISYASRSLTDVERRYSQTEKEALALVWSCERFNLYVMGRKFELETDHKPLECIYSTTSKPCARIERWVLRLQCYDYTVVYRPGKTNIADSLSRLNAESPDKSGEYEDFVRVIAESSTPHFLTAKQIELESDSDPELISVRRYISSGDWSQCKLSGYVGVKSELCSIGKLVMRGSRIVIPQSLRSKVLKLAHEGHQGIVKTKERLRVKVWWPKMDSDTEKICKACHSCQVVGGFNPPEPMQRAQPPSGPWQDLAIDLLGPLPTGESILVIVDYFSRYYEIAIMRSVTSSKIIEVLIPNFSRWGYPFSVKSDNGPQFVSNEFKTFLLENGIEHRLSSPLWPQANGEVERQNRTLLKALKIASVEGKSWREEIYKFLIAYRSTPHTSTGATPSALMLKREIRTKLPELRADREIGNESIRERDWENKLQGKFYADTKRKAVSSQIVPGSEVLLKNTKTSGKLAPNFEASPYTVRGKEGSELTIVSKDGVEYRRNSSFVKPLVNIPAMDKAVENTEPPVECSPQKVIVTPKRVSSRVRSAPVKFNDFIMD